MSVDLQRVLHAVGEPTRFRIVELLSARPHAVGEIAAALGALQPQTTKHLQVLETAGVVRVHSLGRRRVARLDRNTLSEVAAHFTNLAKADPDSEALDRYQEAIDTEEARPTAGGGDRVLRFEREIPVDARRVWAAWTDPVLAARWWAPRHFSVAAFELEPRAGAPIRVVLREGDGTQYESRGRVARARAGRLVFTLAPIDSAGDPLFEARYELTISGRSRAHLVLQIEVSSPRPGAAPAIAGLEPGWTQLLDSLDAHLRNETTPTRTNL